MTWNAAFKMKNQALRAGLQSIWKVILRLTLSDFLLAIILVALKFELVIFLDKGNFVSLNKMFKMFLMDLKHYCVLALFKDNI